MFDDMCGVVSFVQDDSMSFVSLILLVDFRLVSYKACFSPIMVWFRLGFQMGRNDIFLGMSEVSPVSSVQPLVMAWEKKPTSIDGFSQDLGETDDQKIPYIYRRM